MKRITGTIGLFVYVAFFYWIIFAVLVFKVVAPPPTDIHYETALFTEPSESSIYAYLMEDRLASFDIRLALIEHAEETIDFSAYGIKEGLARDVFFGALLDAADRGVKVRILIDGFIEGIGLINRETIHALTAHENIELAYYEPFNGLFPQHFNNRLHDKLMIIDNTYGIIGGRNIGDHFYFSHEPPAKRTEDRDVLLFGTDLPVVSDMSARYETLFSHKYAHIQSKQITNKLEKIQLNLSDSYKNYKGSLHKDIIMEMIYHDAILVDQAVFIHNPLNRLHKEPIILDTLLTLASDYDDLVIQTPYFIMSPSMAQKLDAIKDLNVTILTNSPATNPNILALSGYHSDRNKLAENYTLFEYQKPSSLHTKTLLIGHDISVIGTMNFDHRSIYLSTESMVVIHSESFQNHLSETMEPYFNDSLIVQTDGSLEGTTPVLDYPFAKRVTVGILSLFGRLLKELL